VTPVEADAFLWGAATSAHQVEGGNTNSDCWELEHNGSGVLAEPSGDAADSYHRWGEDMDLLAAAGFTDYRFSIEWARVEPAPGEFSRAQLDHYRRMVAGAHDRGLRPLLTLHHFTNPRWFSAAGGWNAPDAVERYLRYVAALAPLLSDGVRHVCTINEPNIAALFATLQAQAIAHPDLGILEVDRRVSDSLLEAHRMAGRQLRDTHPGLQVGWSVACLNAYDDDASGSAEDYARSRQTVFVEAAADDDWIGVQAYTRTRVGRVDGRAVKLEPGGSRRTLTGWEWYGAALGDAVRDVAARISTPIIVTENGVATDDDQQRIAYTAEALDSLQGARAAGADVRGYFHWSLLDNYEWGSYGPTFGLVSVDRETFVRLPKPSLAWLGAQRVAVAG